MLLAGRTATEMEHNVRGEWTGETRKEGAHEKEGRLRLANERRRGWCRGGTR